MARDIEEFLRKAAQRRQQQKGGGPPPQPPPRRQVAQEPMIIEAVDAEVVEPRRPAGRPVQQPKQPARKKHSLRTGSVSEHVESHLDTSSIGEHAENLGDRIAGVHDQVESRIRQRLDHDLTALDDTKSITDKPSAAIFGARSTGAADALRKMLGNPKTVGQAILVAEILKRPDI